MDLSVKAGTKAGTPKADKISIYNHMPSDAEVASTVRTSFATNAATSVNIVLFRLALILTESLALLSKLHVIVDIGGRTSAIPTQTKNP